MGDAEGGEPMAADADGVFIFGSWAAMHAGGTGHVPNGVDEMVVGKGVDRADLYAAGDRAQQLLGPETCLGGTPHRQGELLARTPGRLEPDLAGSSPDRRGSSRHIPVVDSSSWGTAAICMTRCLRVRPGKHSVSVALGANLGGPAYVREYTIRIDQYS